MGNILEKELRHVPFIEAFLEPLVLGVESLESRIESSVAIASANPLEYNVAVLGVVVWSGQSFKLSFVYRYLLGKAASGYTMR